MDRLKYSLFFYLLMPAQTVLANSILDDATGEPPNRAEAISDLIIRAQQVVFVAAGAIAVGMVIYGGIILASSVGNEERTTKGKKILTYAIGGIIFIILSQILITAFIELLGGGFTGSGGGGGGGVG
ncbi:MAG: hypothetical protein PHW75_01715 [Patescibacteria group bacterium]|nr:hypothetical protein [Patescibacteria group bacterium]